MTCVLFLTGCEQQHEVVTEQIFLPDIGNDKVMEIAEDVLTEMHFTIEKADVESGFIKTRPLSGAQFFEFWRSDNVGVENSLQANLHTIRRTVELDLSPRGEQLCITCNVQVQRLSLPERDVSSSARAYEMFSTSSSSLQTLTLGPEQKKNIAWVDLDKDMQLATEILKRIEKRIVHRTNNEQQTMGNET
jgi:hypothetical protein